MVDKAVLLQGSTGLVRWALNADGQNPVLVYVNVPYEYSIGL